MARRSKGGRTKDGRILVRIGEDSRKRLARNAALEKAASDRAIRKEAKKAATRLRRSQREIAKRAMQLARRLARERARDARRAAKRAGNNKPTEEYNRRREENAENARKKRKKRPFHPRGPYATGKYTSYARRRERSEKLTAYRTSPSTFTCNSYTIKVTTGSNPKALSCTCPDFTQIEGSRSWLGSKAGPFNPCKHMMAIRAVCANCWRFSGQGVNNNAFYEHFACGYNPSYFDNGSGLTLMMNGVNISPFGGYEYRRGTASISRAYTATPSGGGIITTGSCPA